jgi:hypothetical protein
MKKWLVILHYEGDDERFVSEFDNEDDALSVYNAGIVTGGVRELQKKFLAKVVEEEGI